MTYSKEEKFNFAINFDLRVKECKKVFNGDASKAYYLLKKEFKANGFDHDQGSGYVNANKMSYYDLVDILTQTLNNQPWLNQCCTRLRITQINEFIFKGKANKDLLSQVNSILDNERTAKDEYSITLSCFYANNHEPIAPMLPQPEQEKSTCKYTDEEIWESIKQRTKRPTKSNDNDGFSM